MKRTRLRRWGSWGTAGLVVLLTAATHSESPVADAAMRGDRAQVRSLLERGVDVNIPHGDGMTALHWAARKGDTDLVELLLSAGAATEGKTRLGEYTPLLVASRSGEEGAVLALLRGGADAGATTTTGVSALHFAAAGGMVGAIEALLNAGVPVDIEEETAGQTPLIFAASNGRTPAVQLLLSRGADVSFATRRVDLPSVEAEDRQDQRRRTLAMRDARGGAEEGQAGGGEPGQAGAAPAGGGEARPAGEAAPAQPRADDEPQPGGGGGARPLDPDEAPRQEGEPERPLSYTELVGGIGGMTALHHAARQGFMETALALVDAGADLNAQTGGDNASAMLVATMNGHWDLALELLRRGADPNLASDAGSTPLYAAINLYWAPKALYPQPKAHEWQEVDFLEFMEELLKAGADPNVRLEKHLWYMSYNFDLLGVDTAGATPFWRAAYALDIPAMRLLLAYGADPHVPTRKGPDRRRRAADAEDPSGLPEVPLGGPAVFPIHAASGVGYGQDFAGNSHRYVPNGWLPAVRFLVEELGADVNARDHQGYSPVHHAASRGDVELIRYLVEKGADVTVVSRRGQTTADMANGPVQRVEPYPDAIALLESLGSKNNNNCLSC